MWILRTALITAIFFGATPALAQLVLGHISSYTSPFSARVNENAEGAKVYISKINASGGVNGQKINLRALDDENKPEKAVELAKSFIAEKSAIAVFMPAGTPTTDAIAKLTDSTGFALIAPSNGAMLNHSPVRRSVFNLRAPYQLEAEKLISFLKDLGYSRLAVFHDNSSFGKDVLQGAMRGFEKAGYKPVVVKDFDRTKPNFDELSALVRSHPSADLTVFIGASSQAAKYISLAKAINPQMRLATISNSASHGFIKELGANAHSVFVTQVMPGETAPLRIIQEMATDFPAGSASMSPAHIEGYIAAKLAIDAIRAAGKNPTPEKVRTALESMKNHDLGGLIVSFSETDHTGLDFTDVSLISKSGKFIR